jgi:hypothetical protein
MAKPEMKKWRGRVGDVFAVKLGPEMFAFGQICAPGDVAFFDIKSSRALEIDEILRSSLLFRVPMARGGTSKRAWYYLGNTPPIGDLSGEIFYRVQPVGSNQLYKIKGWSQSPATIEEVNDLEPMSWWLCEQLEERLLAW